MGRPNTIRIIFRQILRGRLIFLLFFSASIAVAAPQFLLLASLRTIWELRAVDQAVEDIKTTWITAHVSSSLGNAVIGERLTSRTALTGGIFYDKLGAPAARFGDSPALTFLMWQRQNITQLAEDGHPYLDLYLSPSETGLSDHLIIRVNRRDILENGWTSILSGSIWIPLTAIISGLLTLIMLSAWILRPTTQIRDAAIAAVETPKQATLHQLGWRRRDELGQAGRAVDTLLASTSLFCQDTTTSAVKALDDSNIAVVEADVSGLIHNANSAALALFECTKITDFKRLTTNFIRLAHETGAQDVHLGAVTEDDTYSGPVTILSGSRNIDVFMSLYRTRNASGETVRIVALIVDLSRFSKNMRDMRQSNEDLNGQLVELVRQRQELKQLLQTCLILLSLPKDGDIQRDIRTERLANEWYNEAEDHGLVSGTLTHNALPKLSGDYTLIREIFRQSLLLVYARNTRANPELHVEGRDLSADRVEFTFTVRDGKPLQNRNSSSSIEVQWTLPYSALGRLVKEIGGTILAFSADNVSDPTLIIELPRDHAALQSNPLQKTG